MVLEVAKNPDNTILKRVGHDHAMVTGKITFDSSYPTGGEALDLSKHMPNEIEFISFESDDGYIFQYDRTNKKILAYYFDYNAGADGAAIEVANTTDLSAVVIRFFAVGR